MVVHVSRRGALQLLWLILPSFVVGWFRPELRRARKLHATSYLDGLRGLAALAVFGYHFTDYNLKFFHAGYGIEESSSPLQLPFVRLIYTGKPMVHVFFVISGFALSYRPLQELQAYRIDSCRSVLASSGFRRPIRLLGPCLALTASLIIWCRAGFLHNYLQYQPTLWGQIVDWADDFFHQVTWPWSWEHGKRPRYNVHLWTIPIEFSHSYLLFLVILVLSHLRLHLRRPALMLIMAYTLGCGRWAAFEFLGGCLLADLHLYQHNAELPHHTFSGSFSVHPRRILVFVAKSSALLASGFVMSWPTDAKPFPAPYEYLVIHTPPPFTDENASDFWFALSAVAGVWAVGQSSTLRRVLESPFPQYMGRISFAFYIMQHPVLNLLQSWIMGAEPKASIPGWGLRGWPGVETWSQRMLAWVIGWAVIASVEIWLADVFTATVDEPFVRLARKMEGWACADGAVDEGINRQGIEVVEIQPMHSA
jgi:peptidoglycan/LPS O-acetylase OafA/YrhL